MTRRERSRGRTSARVRRRRSILVLVVVLSLSAGGWAFARSSVFKLSRIDVRGAVALSRAQVIEASGLRIGQSVLGLDRAAVAARVRRIGLVRRAHVDRAGPSALVISIIERAPALEVSAPGLHYLVDDDGLRFEGSVPKGARIPILRVTPVVAPAAASPIPAAKPPSKPAAGKPATGAKDASAPPPKLIVRKPSTWIVRQVLALWHELPLDIRERVRWLEAPTGSSILIRMGRIDVVMGSAKLIDQKVAAIRALVAEATAQRRGLRRIDVRAPRRPAAVVR